MAAVLFGCVQEGEESEGEGVTSFQIPEGTPAELATDMGWSSTAEIKIPVPPPPVGQYKVTDDFAFALSHKPFWLHRVGVRLVLGWRWEAKA